MNPSCEKLRAACQELMNAITDLDSVARWRAITKIMQILQLEEDDVSYRD